jgi:alkylhydroperoxidase family enzyme
MTNVAGDGSPVTTETLVPLLRDDMVSWDTLHERYGSVLKLVEILLGVVPNCDRYLEIWPPGFRTYNVMVPNFLNLPAPIFGVGGAPGDVVGLGMYVTSRVAECPYCSAHACSFAMRRGASPELVAQALVTGAGSCSRGELATIAVARSLARIPCELTAAERDELIAVFGRERAEWIVLAIVMMGFLNKFMNAIGVELEQPVLAEVKTTIGPEWDPGAAGAALPDDVTAKPPPRSDGLRTKLRVVPLIPGVVRLDAQWQKGVPKTWPAAGEFLRERVGHDFPVLSRLRHKRAVRAITTMLRDNLDASTSVIGLDVKVLAGLVFCTVVADEPLAADMRALAGPGAELEAALHYARCGDDAALPPGDAELHALLKLARAASPSPAELDAETVAACRESGLSAGAIVELITWLSVLQMLHRLSCFYAR